MNLSIRVMVSYVVLLFVASPARAEQTIVFLRHGEKPAAGLGQLTCQGLNRSLALPSVLNAKFGVPDFVYAPDPSIKINDPGGSFYYVRPLATIEPLAIKYGVSVNTNYAYSDVVGLQNILIRSSKANATIFVAWEHSYLVKVVQNIINAYGGGAAVPPWASGDFDTLYILHVTYGGDGSIHARFETDHQNLNNQPLSCPF